MKLYNDLHYLPMPHIIFPPGFILPPPYYFSPSKLFNDLHYLPMPHIIPPWTQFPSV